MAVDRVEVQFHVHEHEDGQPFIVLTFSRGGQPVSAGRRLFTFDLSPGTSRSEAETIVRLLEGRITHLVMTTADGQDSGHEGTGAHEGTGEPLIESGDEPHREPEPAQGERGPTGDQPERAASQQAPQAEDSHDEDGTRRSGRFWPFIQRKT